MNTGKTLPGESTGWSLRNNKIAMHRKSIAELKARVVKLGAKDCKVIDIKTVKTAAWVRYKCQFGCSGFGESFTCPPYSPTPAQTQEVLDCYRKALLINVAGGSHEDVSEIVLRAEKEAFLAGYYKALGLGAGPCRLCRTCNTKGYCRNRDDARPAMEACGIDVFSTVRANGFTIDTLDSTGCQANYFGLVLLE